MRIKDPQVADVFRDYPHPYRKKLEGLRKLILQVAKSSEIIQELEETLKWGQPSFLPKPKSIGTTVRIHHLRSKPNQYGIYFHCQTTLVAKFKKKYPGLFQYDGKRAIIFGKEDKVPVRELQDCIFMALTYHWDKKKRKSH